MLILSGIFFAFGVLMIGNGYHIHRLTKPEFFAGLAAGCSLGLSLLALAASVAN
jgi:hypothetical protein